ncbi:MAG: VWA domain-containing protein [Gemmataceae bacterium]|nr:VWA domain-containing protein [Gemmataceae bacterium]
MAKIHIERMMHRKSIAVLGESAATYSLVKLIPTGGGASAPMGLNLALVLDVSGSMYEEDGTGVSRLQRVQDAAIGAIQSLKPEDTLAVVAFANNALTLLPSTPLAQKDTIVDIIRKIDMFDVDPGGTSMDEGMELGLVEVAKLAGPGRLSQVVVLTDGETSGEKRCRELAQQAAQQKMHLTLMGVGTDWKAELVKDLAKLSEGKWYYIDVNKKEEAERIFVEEFQALAATGFQDVEMHLRVMKEIKLKRVRQVVPEIKELNLVEPEERHFVAKLGTMQHDQATRYILDLSLPKRPDGKYVLAQMEVTYDVGSGKRETSGMVPLEMEYTAAGHGYVNAEVMRHIDDVQLFEMNKKLQDAIVKENKEEVKKVAEQIEQKGALMGVRAAKKTMLAKQALEEMNVGGRVSKKTMLAMDDAAREAEQAPTG